MIFSWGTRQIILEMFKSAEAMETWPCENMDVLVRIGAQRLRNQGLWSVEIAFEDNLLNVRKGNVIYCQELLDWIGVNIKSRYF